MSGPRAEALGQLLMIGLAEERWSSALERFVRSVNPGGVILSARHLRKPEATAELLRSLALALPSPPILALEEEGGPVDPLRAFFPPLPSPQSAAQKGHAAVTQLGELIGAGLRLIGFNTVFAPLLDVPSSSSKSRLGARVFSAHAQEVAKCGQAFVRGTERSKILPCAKYFPGLGAADIAIPADLPSVGKSMIELWSEDLVPYRQIFRRLPLAIVGHGAYKAYDFDISRPATHSPKVVEGLLRIKLGYSGVAVADALDSPALRHASRPEEAGVQSLNAGCDLLIVGFREKSIELVLNGLKKGVESGKLSPPRAEQALSRVLRISRSLDMPRGRFSQEEYRRLAQRFEEFSKGCRRLEQKIA